MKRTAATILMLAGLGGCASTDSTTARPFGQISRGKEVPGVMGATGEPVHVAAGQMPTGKDTVTRADAKIPANSTDTGIRQTAGFARVSSGGGGGVMTGLGGGFGGGCPGGNCGPTDPNPYGPTGSRFGTMINRGPGILPVPAMGMPGAVAAVGAIGGPGSGIYPPMYMNQRTSVRFASPQGMKITWQVASGTYVEPPPLESPGRYNFPQGNMYRLRLSGIPNRPGKVFYPSLEIYPATPNTVTYLSHNAVPVSFADEDFEQATAGNLVIKVVYLPSQQYQDLAAVAGADEVVSTRLEPGVNPVDEANRRGTILAVIRLGNIDLQDPNTPPPDAPAGVMPGMGAAPRMMVSPPGASLPSPAMPTAPVPAISVPKLPGASPAPFPASTTKPSEPTKPIKLP